MSNSIEIYFAYRWNVWESHILNSCCFTSWSWQKLELQVPGTIPISTLSKFRNNQDEALYLKPLTWITKLSCKGRAQLPDCQHLALRSTFILALEPPKPSWHSLEQLHCQVPQSLELCLGGNSCNNICNSIFPSALAKRKSRKSVDKVN